MAISAHVAGPGPVLGSGSASSGSGSPSMMTVASASMVGCRKATVAVSVTPVRSSMSLAIATASREDRPSSTIGADSSIEPAGCPVELATQLRSHSRISGTDISVRGALSSFSGASSDRFAPALRSCGRSRAASVDSDIGPFGRHSVSSGKALATFPDRRLPSR